MLRAHVINPITTYAYTTMMFTTLLLHATVCCLGYCSMYMIQHWTRQHLENMLFMLALGGS